MLRNDLGMPDVMTDSAALREEFRGRPLGQAAHFFC